MICPLDPKIHHKSTYAALCPPPKDILLNEIRWTIPSKSSEVLQQMYKLLLFRVAFPRTFLNDLQGRCCLRSCLLGEKARAVQSTVAGGACGRWWGRWRWPVRRTWQHVERGRMWAPKWPWAAGQLCSGWRGTHGSIWSKAALLEATVTAVVMSWSSFKSTLCNLTDFFYKKRH